MSDHLWENDDLAYYYRTKAIEAHSKYFEERDKNLKLMDKYLELKNSTK